MRQFITRNLFDPLIATSIVAVLMLLSLFVAGYTNERRTVATGAPIIIVATPTLPAARPTPRAVPVLFDSRPRLERAIIAYDAPGGNSIGAVETGRLYRVIGVSGDWLQLDLAGSGTVWTPTGAFYGVATLPTVEPTTAPAAPAAPAQGDAASLPTIAPGQSLADYASQQTADIHTFRRP